MTNVLQQWALFGTAAYLSSFNVGAVNLLLETDSSTLVAVRYSSEVVSRLRLHAGVNYQFNGVTSEG